MAGLEDLAAAMLGTQAQKEIAAENPYYRLAPIASDVGNTAITLMAKDPKKNLKEGLLWGLGSGLLGGLTQGLGDSYQEKLTDRYTNAMMTGQGAEELPLNLFRKYKQDSNLFNLQRMTQDYEARRDLENEMEKERRKAALDVENAGPKKRAEILAEDEAWRDAEGAVQPIAKPASVPFVETEESVSEAPTIAGNPNNPRYKERMRISERDEDARRALEKEMRALEADYTTKLSTGAAAQGILTVQQRAQQVLDAIKDDNPLNATTAIYGFAKVIDPTGTVRDSDAQMVADPGGPLGALAVIHNQILQKGRLTPESKAAMAKLVPQIVKSQYAGYRGQVEAMVKAAKKQGANPDNIGFIQDMPIGGTTSGASGTWSEQQPSVGGHINGEKITGVERIG